MSSQHVTFNDWVILIEQILPSRWAHTCTHTSNIQQLIHVWVMDLSTHTHTECSVTVWEACTTQCHFCYSPMIKQPWPFVPQLLCWLSQFTCWQAVDRERHAELKSAHHCVCLCWDTYIQPLHVCWYNSVGGFPQILMWRFWISAQKMLAMSCIPVNSNKLDTMVIHVCSSFMYHLCM